MALQSATITLDNATQADLGAILAIYAPYVARSTVTMEEAAPTLKDMEARWQDTQSRNLPFLVARNGDAIAGYAYTFPYRTRSGYRFTVEESVYVADGFQGRGVGKMLLGELIVRCRLAGLSQMVAVIAGTGNSASIRLHESLGFCKAGVLERVGFKADQWIDTVLMQKQLQ